MLLLPTRDFESQLHSTLLWPFLLWNPEQFEEHRGQLQWVHLKKNDSLITITVIIRDEDAVLAEIW